MKSVIHYKDTTFLTKLSYKAREKLHLTFKEILSSKAKTFTIIIPCNRVHYMFISPIHQV